MSRTASTAKNSTLVVHGKSLMIGNRITQISTAMHERLGTAKKTLLPNSRLNGGRSPSTLPLRCVIHMRLALLFLALSLFPWALGSDVSPPAMANRSSVAPAALGSTVIFPSVTGIAFSSMNSPIQKEQCPCNLDNMALETKSRNKPRDPFNGNAALLFAYAQALANIIAPDMDTTDSRLALYLTPPFYPGITVEQPNPGPLMNYQLWQYADSLLPIDSPVWNYGGGSYFDFYGEYLSYASVNGSLKSDPTARNKMLHLFNQLKNAAKAVDKAKAAAIATYKQLAVQATGDRGTLPPELRNLTVWLEENATYRVSQENLNEITQLYNNARLEYYGPGVKEISDLLTKVAQAKEYLKPVEGDLNMPCTSSPQSWADRLKEARSGKSSTTQSSGDLFYKPKYSLNADYAQIVDFWSDEYRRDISLKTIFTLSLDDLSKVDIDWDTLGFPNIDKGRDEGISPKDTILSLQTKTQTLTPQVEEIVISATNFQTFNINRGSWDKSDFKACFPKLRADAPIRLTVPIVRPSRFLFAYGVQIEVRINGSEVREFAYGLDQMGAKSANLLGVTRGLQVKDNVVTTKTEDDTDPGYPYLLAVLGERL
ncbi:hypothetical protein TWF730_006946 [Orbilia blumenaviensis]|uniref:Uncharacterized protein n=1 Tax=Orbilia blumenaviensis TaxID=1796055 RepID=A0AAV9VIC2_9PEZI